MTTPPQVLVIGVGNDYGGDDAIGHVVARELKTIEGERIRVVEESGEGAALIEAWKGADLVIVIDAVRSGGAVGTIYRFDAQTQSIPGRLFGYSTHAFSVVEAIELARTLNQLPARLIVYGIEGRSFQSGAELSKEVKTAAGEVVQRIGEELRASARS